MAGMGGGVRAGSFSAAQPISYLGMKQMEEFVVTCRG